VPRRYLVFNKPFNVLSRFTPDREEPVSGGLQPKTLAAFIAVPDVYPAGRLDRDSEGLLLLTNDGRLQHQISDPRFAHPRTYCVQVEGTVTDATVTRLASGVVIKGRLTRPCEAQGIEPPSWLWVRDPPIRFRANIPTSWIELTLTEGRNRQVRRMTATVGFPALRLIRIAIGTLRLKNLQPGMWRDLTASEVERLRKFSGSGCS
jgi:23S rRNA pseudouridine2457 synthase